MYTKNLSNDFRLRLSDADMDFLKCLAEERGSSVSEVTRSIIGEYRRALDQMDTLKKAINLVNGGGTVVHGDTKTNIND